MKHITEQADAEHAAYKQAAEKRVAERIIAERLKGDVRAFPRWSSNNRSYFRYLTGIEMHALRGKTAEVEAEQKRERTGGRTMATAFGSGGVFICPDGVVRSRALCEKLGIPVG